MAMVRLTWKREVVGGYCELEVVILVVVFIMAAVIERLFGAGVIGDFCGCRGHNHSNNSALRLFTPL
jgi:hypothetical protein